MTRSRRDAAALTHSAERLLRSECISRRVSSIQRVPRKRCDIANVTGSLAYRKNSGSRFASGDARRGRPRESTLPKPCTILRKVPVRCDAFGKLREAQMMRRSSAIFAAAVTMVASIALAQQAAKPGAYSVIKSAKVGGEGGFDYIFADVGDRRLYVPRRRPGHLAVFNLDTLEPLGGVDRCRSRRRHG